MAYSTSTTDTPPDTVRNRHQRRLSFFVLFFTLTTLLSNGLSHAAGTPKNQETAWAQALVKSIDANEIRWLTSSEEKFIALYKHDFSATLQGGVILLHGMGGHPDWTDVISPLRQSLPQHGWSTLSIQLPAFERGAQISDYSSTIATVSARIDAAIKEFRNEEIANIVLLGYGLGAIMGASYLATNSDSGIAAFVAVSMPTYQDGEAWMQLTNTIEKLRVPMLDIYARGDLNSVINYTEQRARAAHRGGMNTSENSEVTQATVAKRASSERGDFIAYQVIGANHFFTGHEQLLSKRIIGWLKHHADSADIQK